jgi:hypothetical protein
VFELVVGRDKGSVTPKPFVGQVVFLAFFVIWDCMYRRNRPCFEDCSYNTIEY